MWPLEVQAGMDAVELRNKLGKKCILSGNIDKRALAQGKEAIKEEIDKKVPFLLSQGGYFPGPDHFVPEDVSLENFQFYLEYLRSFDRS
jgi:uroporphyrinogen-III decarboxylase